jgi:hypothetical protein
MNMDSRGWNELSIGDLLFYLWFSGREAVIEDGRIKEVYEWRLKHV